VELVILGKYGVYDELLVTSAVIRELFYEVVDYNIRRNFHVYK
tara:strand:+ start:1253 stop:1381 length:129 start_codon:yes stop_codon:yes gene_type:complete